MNIKKRVQDTFPYFGTQRKDKTVQYVLNYDNSRLHGYILIRPNYMKSIPNKTENTNNLFYSFEDYHFSGFTAPDSLDGDNVCAHKYKSGWRFPLRYTKTVSDQLFCAHNPSVTKMSEVHEDIDDNGSSIFDLSTNINGVYREEEDRNERGIVYCGRGIENTFEDDQKKMFYKN